MHYFCHRLRATIELWCNGNTADFGSVILSSNLGSSTRGQSKAAQKEKKGQETSAVFCLFFVLRAVGKLARYFFVVKIPYFSYLCINYLIMIFRKATIEDIDSVTAMIKAASARLGAAGIDQWQRGYPNRESVERDVENGVGMVLCEGDTIIAYGAVIFTGEPAYNDLTGGKWLTEGDYAVVHRLCVNEIFVGMGFAKRFMSAAEAMASESVKSMRIDTHPDNKIMQSLIDRMGYNYCGDVVIESRRLAYEKILE